MFYSDEKQYSDPISIHASEKEKKMLSISEFIEANYDNVIMQYTGLKDKNGKEIYEGDVDKFGRCIKWFDDLSYDGGGAKHPGFYFSKSRSLEGDGELSYHDDLYDCEIVGNIHENPELLK